MFHSQLSRLFGRTKLCPGIFWALLLLGFVAHKGSAQTESWTSQDIGAPALAGSTTYDAASDTFTIQGAGTDIWDTADQFQYAYQAISGDCEIVARVASLVNTDPWAKAGVMIRETLNGNSKEIFIAVTPGHGLAGQWRSATGGTSTTFGAGAGAAPMWMKLKRFGNQITLYRSTDGQLWAQVTSQTISMDATAYAGLAVCSHNVNARTTATFDHVSLTAGGNGTLQSPWNHVDIGNTGYQGDAIFDGAGTFTLRGSGADIWGTADAFHFLYQPLVGDGAVQGRVASQTNVNGWAKAGSMIRETLGVGSAHGMAIVSPSNGVLVQGRTASGGGSFGQPALAGQAPVWTKVERRGEMIIGWKSSDGTTWDWLGSQRIPMTAQVYAGMIVTAHDNTKLAEATFDGVQVTPGRENPLPAPWNEKLIGTPGFGGWVSYANSAYQLFSGAGDAWGTADQGEFIYQALNGDGAVTLKVDSLVNSNGWAKIGVMLRESLDVNAKNLFWAVSPSNGVVLQKRIATGGATTSYFDSVTKAPVWLKIERMGNMFVALKSADGVTWSVYATETVPMAGSIYAGALLCSPGTTTIGRGQISGMTLGATTDETGNGLPDLWEQQYFHETGVNPQEDRDGDGLSNLAEYQQGSDPTSFYSQGSTTFTPVMSVVSGDAQTAFDGAWLRDDLVVSIIDSTTGQPIPNAPVAFTVSKGDAALSTTHGGATATTVSMRTDANGTALVAMKMNDDLAAKITVTTEGSSTTAAFTEGSIWPLARWNFETGDTTSVADLSGNGKTATANGTLTVSQGIEGANAFFFNGASYLQSPIPGQGTATLMAWIRPTSSPDVSIIQSVFDCDVAGQYGTGWGLDNGKIKVILDNQFWDTGVSIALNVWQHVALVYDATTAKVYVNGILRASLNYIQGSVTTANYRIGRSNANALYFNGDIDDARIYGSALTDADFVFLDRNGNGLPDKWEFSKFGTLDNDGSEDSDGDGFSDKAEFQAGSNPEDFYQRPDGNGGATTLTPTIKLLSGAAVYGEAGTLTPALRVKVTSDAAGAQPLANAPVTFTVSGGYAGLTTGGAAVSALTLRTDANGIAAIDSALQTKIVRFLCPDPVGTTRQITMAAGTTTATITATTTAPAQNVSPTAYWPLNEGSGTTVFDAAGGDYDGTLTGTVNWTAGHDTLGGIDFPAGDATARVRTLVDAPDLNFGQSSFSVALWFKTTAAGVHRMLSKGAWSGSPGYFMSLGHGANGRVGFGIGSTGTSRVVFSTTEAFNDGAWHHGVAIYDAATHKASIYVDGVLRTLSKNSNDSGTIVDGGTAIDLSAVPQLQATTTESLFLGSYNGTNEKWVGELDDIALYGVALNALDVQNLYRGTDDGSGVDTTAPSAPTNLRSDAASESTVRLRWNASSDDTGVSRYRVYRDGQLLEETAKTVFTDSTISAGNSYTYTVAAIDAAGNQSQPSQPLAFTAPQLRSAGTGLIGQYFSQLYLRNPVMSRTDPKIDFSWGWDSPASNIPGDGFSICWTGLLEPKVTGVYEFKTPVDNAARIWIDGRLIAAVWPFESPNSGGFVRLQAGKLVSIVVEFFEVAGAANIQMQWKSPLDSDFTVVPTSALYPKPPLADTVAPAAPQDVHATLTDENGFRLAWVPTQDDIGAATYHIFRDGQEVARVNIPQWRDTHCDPGTDYTYTVKAEDFAGNLSPLSAPLQLTTATRTLPEPWRHRDISEVATDGTATFADNVFTVAGVGGDFQNALFPNVPDEFQFAYQKVSGDVSITARVDSFNGWIRYAKAGVAIRASLDPLAKYAISVISHGFNLEAPFWFRVVRIGNTFYDMVSPDGVQWQVTRKETLDMPQEVYVGMLVASKDGRALATAKFSHVTVTSAVDKDLQGDTGLDTDNDGISDWQETNLFHTNPGLADIWVTGVVADMTGSQGVTAFGSWAVDGDALVSETVKASVDYAVTITDPGIYRVQFELASGKNDTADKDFPVSIYVDGQFVERFDVYLDGTESGFIHAATPWLSAGTHTIRLSYDNTLSHRSLKILGMKLQSLGGLDPDANGIPGWMNNRLDLYNNIKPITESLVSPAFVEGTSHYLKALKLRAEGNDIAVKPAPGFGWYANIPLNPAAPIQGSAEFENAGRTDAFSITWKPFNVLLDAPAQGQPPVTIRDGDSLLLTAHPQEGEGGSTVVTITRPDSSEPVQIAVSDPRQQPQPYLFDVPGSYTLNATFTAADGTVTAAPSVTVKVLDVAFNGDPVVGFYRQPPITWDNPQIPDEAVVVEDQGVWLEELSKLPQGGAKFSLWSSLDEGIVAARLGSATGPIAAHAFVHTIRVASDEATAVDVLATFDDGSSLVGTPIMLSNITADTKLVVDIVVGGVTFDDGTGSKTFTAADFDQFGRVYVKFILPKGVNSAFCHRIKLYQGDTYLGIF
jgi:regulation of enolase protein 1 (concanavalin A-like superfamily)